MGKLTDLTGQKFGRLTVIKQGEDYISPKGARKARWICLCDCQLELPEEKRKTKLIVGESLKSGLTTSCGCYKDQKTIERNINRRKHNKYDLSGEYGIGYTLKGEAFYFDLEDYDLIKDYYWYITDSGYVKTCYNRKGILFHRLVMNVLDSKYLVDHIAHITVDNRKSQLRIVTDSENQMNKCLQSNNKTGVPGLIKKDDRWEVYITVNKNCIFLGSSKNKEEAIKIRRDAEEKYFGEYSYLNSIKLNMEEIA